MKKRYFDDNRKLLSFINKNKDNIIEIRLIRKYKKNRLGKIKFISSYCVTFRNSI